MDEDLFYTPAVALAAMIRGGELSSEEFTRALLERIARSELNAFAFVDETGALAAAREADRAVRDGSDPRPLQGVPVSVKDNIETAGIPTTYGSRALADHIPGRDAVVVERIRAAGALVIGKTTLPEFATKGVVDSPLHGVTRNPWNLSKVVGGSSGGAAAAVAAGLGPLALGNDQAGSVRIPAALCGVAGFKPTGGRIPFAPNLFPWDEIFHVGLLSRSVDDIRLALGAVEGVHPDDPLSVPAADALLRGEDRGARLRVAWSPDAGFARVDPEVLGIVREALEAIPDVEIEEADLDLSPAESAYATLVPHKRAIETGDRLDAWADVMDPEVVAYIRSGMDVGVDRLRSAYRDRTATFHEVERVLASCDVIVTPTLSVAAFDIGRTAPESIDGVPTTSFRDWFPFTYPFNLTGHPAISLPAGLTREGLPVGIQIVGPRFADRSVLALAAQLEAARPWAHLRPRSR